MAIMRVNPSSPRSRGDRAGLLSYGLRNAIVVRVLSPVRLPNGSRNPLNSQERRTLRHWCGRVIRLVPVEWNATRNVKHRAGETRDDAGCTAYLAIDMSDCEAERGELSEPLRMLTNRPEVIGYNFPTDQVVSQNAKQLAREPVDTIPYRPTGEPMERGTLDGVESAPIPFHKRTSGHTGPDYNGSVRGERRPEMCEAPPLPTALPVKPE